MMTTFRKGDRVLGMHGVGEGTVVYQKVNEVWAFWDSDAGSEYPGPFFMPVDECTLIERAMMEYNPEQQGDTEDDI